MGHEGVPRVIENNACANILGVQEVYYGIVQVENSKQGMLEGGAYI